MDLEQARAAYDRHGHVHVEGMLDRGLLLELRTAFVEHFRLDDTSRPVAAEPFDIGTVVPVARDVMANERVAETACHLLAADRVRVWHDQVIIRPAGGGAATRWHQDLAFWPMKAPTALTCWIPLHDVDGSTGCLRFLRGSHRWGNRPSIVPRPLEDILADAPAPALESGEVFELPMRMGDCDFHHGLVFHGAAANTSGVYRITYKVIYMDVHSELGPDVFAAATA